MRQHAVHDDVSVSADGACEMRVVVKVQRIVMPGSGFAGSLGARTEVAGELHRAGAHRLKDGAGWDGCRLSPSFPFIHSMDAAHQDAAVLLQTGLQRLAAACV